MARKASGDYVYRIGFFLAAVIFISIGLITYRSSSKVNEMDSQIRKTHRILITLDGVREKLKNAIISHRDFLLTGNQRDLMNFRNGPARVRLQLAVLADLVRQDSLLSVKTNLLRQTIDEKLDALETSVVMRLNGASLDSVNHFMDEYARRSLYQIRVISGEFEEIENARLRGLTLVAARSIKISRIYIVAGNLLAFLLLLLSFAALNRQIATRKHAEYSLKEQMERLEVVTRNIGAGLAIIQSNLYITWINEVMRNLFGNLEGESFLSLFPDEERNKGFYLHAETGKHKPRQEERLLRNKKGDTDWFQLILTPLGSTENNGMISYLLLLVPIGVRKKMEESLQKAKEKAEESNRAKSEFLANMSHEIRTPMNAVLGFTEILRGKNEGDPVLDEYLQGIELNGKTLIRIIDDILDLSKIEAGKMQIEKEMCDPRSLLEEIRTMFGQRAKQRGIDLRISTNPDLPAALELDETRIRQILFNLVGNALKFTHSGYIEVSFQSLKTRNDPAEEEKTDLLIQVKDTGMGIPREQQELIFQPFSQQSGQDSRVYGGTGLGLTITRRLLEMMGGTISLESTVNEGSNFIIMLPGIKTGHEAGQKADSQQDAMLNVRFRDSKILIVEDQESNRKVVRDLLAGMNIHLIEASDGKEGFEKAVKTHPQLIFMDLHMPVMDGFTARRKIAGQKDLRSVPVIALTASGMKENLGKLSESFDDYLIKPVNRKDLIRKLIHFLPYEGIPQPSKEIRDQWDAGAMIRTLKEENQTFPDAMKHLFRDELHPVYEHLRRKMSVNRIKSFALRIIDAGKEYNVEAVEQYGNMLLEMSKSFHTRAITDLLAYYPSMEGLILNDNNPQP